MSAKKQELLTFDEALYLFKFSQRIIGILPPITRAGRLIVAYVVVSSFFNHTMFMVDWAITKSLSVDVIYETLATVGCMVRFYILLINRREFTRLMDACAELWDYCDSRSQPLVTSYEGKIRKYFWLTFGSMCALNVLYSANAINVSYLSGPNATKILPFRWYGVQDAGSVWPGYGITFAVQVMVVYNGGFISATVDSALPLLMVLCCGYFQVLRRRLYGLMEKSQLNPALADYELIQCCKFHQKILALCSEVEILGRPVFLVALASSGYTLGLIALKLAGADPDKYKYLPVLAVLSLQVLACQWAPDLMMDESEKVSTAVYSVSLAFMNRPSSKHAVIMILRAQQELVITAGGIVVLSLRNFGKMLSSAVSLFTTMRNFEK